MLTYEPSELCPWSQTGWGSRRIQTDTGQWCGFVWVSVTFSMAVQCLGSESVFSLKAYHVTEELGFILPAPLVSGKTVGFKMCYYHWGVLKSCSYKGAQLCANVFSWLFSFTFFRRSEKFISVDFAPLLQSYATIVAFGFEFKENNLKLFPVNWPDVPRTVKQ